MYTNIIRQNKELLTIGALYYSILEANRYRTKTQSGLKPTIVKT